MLVDYSAVHLWISNVDNVVAIVAVKHVLLVQHYEGQGYHGGSSQHQVIFATPREIEVNEGSTREGS